MEKSGGNGGGGELLLDNDAAAALLKVSPRTLERWRLEGRGPSYVKVGPKLRCYTRDALEAFIRQNTVRSGGVPRVPGRPIGRARRRSPS